MIYRFPVFVLLFALAVPVMADRADRQQVVNMEADTASMDDAKKVLILSGNVKLTQGTMLIRAAKVVVTQDVSGFQKGVAHGAPGKPARFKQKREGREDYVEGEAERIEHDARTEKTEFFGNAKVKSGGDEVTGHFIAFDGVTERYVVTGGASSTGETPRRVHATIQPKSSPQSADQ